MTKVDWIEAINPPNTQGRYMVAYNNFCGLTMIGIALFRRGKWVTIDHMLTRDVLGYDGLITHWSLLPELPIAKTMKAGN
ncbi:hypothetical protein N9137_00765 [Pseudomonadales bacterium]|nr:hypothetical protein [Pseudomonadales bacterium]